MCLYFSYVLKKLKAISIISSTIYVARIKTLFFTLEHYMTFTSDIYQNPTALIMQNTPSFLPRKTF